MTIKARHPLVDQLVSIQQRDGLTGTEMSTRLGVAGSSYTRLLSGELQPSLRLVQSVCRAFPELQSFCASLLQIDNHETSDQQVTVAS